MWCWLSFGFGLVTNVIVGGLQLIGMFASIAEEMGK